MVTPADEARELAPATAVESQTADTPMGDPSSAGSGDTERGAKARSDDRRRGREIPEGRDGKWARDGPRDRYDNRRGRNALQRGRGNNRNKNDRNYKKPSDEFKNLPESSDLAEIAGQLRFYFSLRNLCSDFHLFTQLGGPHNFPIRVQHIAGFNRMQRFKPYSAIIKAIGTMSELVLVTDGVFAGPGNEGIKLSVPLVAPAPKSTAEKPPSLEGLFYRMKEMVTNNPSTSVYIKGFEVDDTEPGQIALENEYRPYGSIEVRKRRDDFGNFKGSIFVDFGSDDAQAQFLNLDPKPKWNGKDLIIMGKKEYVEMKCKEKGIKPDWDRTEEEKQEERRERRREKDAQNRARGDNKPWFGGRGRGAARGRGGSRNGYGLDRGRRDRDHQSSSQSPEPMPTPPERKTKEDPVDSDMEDARLMEEGKPRKRKAGDDLDGNGSKKPKMTFKFKVDN